MKFRTRKQLKQEIEDLQAQLYVADREIAKLRKAEPQYKVTYQPRSIKHLSVYRKHVNKEDEDWTIESMIQSMIPSLSNLAIVERHYNPKTMTYDISVQLDLVSDKGYLNEN